MHGRDRRLAILMSLGYLVIGGVGWITSTLGPDLSSRPGGGGSGMGMLWLAAGLLAGLQWASGAAAASLGPRSAPIITWTVPAIVGPVALAALVPQPGVVPALVVAVLWPVSVVPLGLSMALASRVYARSLVALTLSIAGAAVVLGIVPVLVADVAEPDAWSIARYLAVVGVAAVPGLARVVVARSASPAGAGALGSGTAAAAASARSLTTGQIAEQSTIVVAIAAPLVAGLILVTPLVLGLMTVVIAIVAVVVAAAIVVWPLAWVARRADAQRDLAVAVSEAERTRLAADLHDGPLQDVLLLARRLDEAGDAAGAEMARGIGSDLRELSGDLRLPLLDDLGVGPALDWLAGRMRRMTAVDIQVVYTTEGRVPPDVELAAFRIAQEAIANAVRHGSPPILVRCDTTASALTMTIEDAGGERRVSTTAADDAVRGRFGLLNMQQRAEQVGARLEWHRPRSGGTRVALEWRASGA